MRSLILALLVLPACATRPALRKFPDRPVAWREFDDGSLSKVPEQVNWHEFRQVHSWLETARSADRALAMKVPVPAEDVNALDEVPCSTWFCPRNHLRPMTPEEIGRGPGLVGPPVAPLTIQKSKGAGAALGLLVEDARGTKYLVKFDPAGHIGLQTGAEVLGARLFHAAGFHVPDAHIVDLDDDDLRIKPGATRYFERFALRPLTEDWLRERMRAFARTPDGKLRAVAIAFLPGKALGGYDFQGTRDGDPNDRIPHELRRSVRATRTLSAWLNRFDTGPANTLDVLVEEGGRRFVRHYVLDFGSTLGAASITVQKPNDGAEQNTSPMRIVRAFLTVGAWQRWWQKQRDEWNAAIRRYPGIGFFPTEGWSPDRYRSNFPYAAYDLMTPADDYFGAKLIATFTDAQLRAAVEVARYRPEEAAELVRALAYRRDVIARRYLNAVTAVESPSVNEAGTLLCFRDLAIERGAAAPSSVAYRIDVRDDQGARLLSGRAHPAAARGCVDIGRPDGRPYRIVTVRATTPRGKAAPVRVHLARRDAERRWVVVGMERDE